MKKRTVYSMVVLLVSCTMIMCWISVVSAQGAAEAESSGAFLEKTFEVEGMPLFTGVVWQKASPDEKVAFIWGASHVVTIEQALMAEFKQLKVENFSAKVVEGMSGVTMNEIVRKVDAFYAANPDKLQEPVMAVIWDTLIEPNIKTGVAGLPLE